MSIERYRPKVDPKSNQEQLVYPLQWQNKQPQPKDPLFNPGHDLPPPLPGPRPDPPPRPPRPRPCTPPPPPSGHEGRR